MVIPVLVHKIVLYSTALVSLMGNGLLLALLAHRTARALGNYRLLLAAFVLADMLTSAFDAWFVPMFVFREFGFLYFGYGALHLPPGLGMAAECTHVATFYLPFVLISIHFIYRFLSLTRPSFLREHFGIFLPTSLLYITMYLAAILFIFVSLTKQHANDDFYQPLVAYAASISDNPPANVIAVVYVDDNSDLRWPTLQLIAVCGLIGGHTMVICVVCIVKILSSMKTRVLQIRVRRLHMQLFRALLIQFVVPLLLSFLPFAVIITVPAFGMPLPNLGNICSLTQALFPAIDPLLITVSIPRFRGTILEWAYRASGRTAKVNEKRAMERSRALASMFMRKSTNTLDYTPQLTIV